MLSVGYDPFSMYRQIVNKICLQVEKMKGR